VSPDLPDPPAGATANAEETLLAVVRETCRDVQRDRSRLPGVTLSSSLDRDLALDSLARVELLLRIERTFGVALPEDTLARAETPQDLLAAIRAGRPTAAARVERARPVRPEVTDESQAAEPAEASTLLDVLDWHVRRHPERVQITFLSDAGEEDISYGKLHAGAVAVAAGLLRAGLEARQAVAIMLPTSPDYFYTYFGILLAGGIPVPIYPPARLAQIEEHVRRHGRILANAQAKLLVTVPEGRAVGRLLEAAVPGLRRVLVAADLTQGGGEPGRVAVAAEDIAFIQYTSGSTGDPKGVVLAHANLLANIRAMAQALEATPRDVFVSWLPLYHDMGLIGAWLGSLYVGMRLVVMSPLAFLSHPERWLWTIHRYRGTLTAAPNFAYELCLKRIDDAQLAGLDLASMRFMANGAEAVSPDTMARFAARFAPFGLKAAALTPVYGLAECAVGLLFPPLGRGCVVDRIDRETFERERRAVPAAADAPNPLRFVACGRPLRGHAVRVVDEDSRETGERIEGRIEFRGPSATPGYYRNEDATARLRRDGWLDTGDRAYVADGDVYITGRVKDIVIRGGRNLYPHELEEAVGALPGVRKGCVAVFGSPDPQSGTERLVVLAETPETDAARRDALRAAVDRVTVDVLGEPADAVVLAPPHTVLKTSSGKVRRSATRELWEAGRVGAPSRAPWWQAVRLVAASVLPQLQRGARAALAAAHGAWAFLLFWLFAPVTWLLTALTPRPEFAWRVGRTASRLLFRLAGIPFDVKGVEHLPRGAPSVLVVNHASYLDGVVLVGALPRQVCVVAKRELRDQFVPRVFLERLGAEFVERFDARQSVADSNRLSEMTARGVALAFFAEGTFTAAPGLLPFHLGAFVVAARAGVPVVPVTIHGTRSLLRADRWFPRPGPLAVTIGAPIAPPADVPDAFAAAVRLRDLARTEILRHCGEPDLA
jgi:1-acyl-sn-glycerol-3-phosphate acyltransferase